jgi:hypothetical protein
MREVVAVERSWPRSAPTRVASRLLTACAVSVALVGTSAFSAPPRMSPASAFCETVRFTPCSTTWNAKPGDDEGAARNGDVVGTPTPLRDVPPAISAVADGSLVVYLMPGIHGKQIHATSMLFVPKGPVPSGGWPLMVWGHGTTGWAPHCGPSAQLQDHGTWIDKPNDAVLAAVLRRGIAVMAPDYEGLGPVADGVRLGHGYYNLPSEGKSMVFAAVAARRYLGGELSGQWAPVGWSEGGFSALAAAYYSAVARAAEPSLDYRGTITLAPVPDIPAMNRILWSDIRRASRSGRPPTDYQVDQLVFANAETVYFTKAENFAGYRVDPEVIYGPSMLKIYREDWRACLDDLNVLVKRDILAYLAASPRHRLDTYPGIRGDAPNYLPEVKRYFDENQGKLENSTLPGSILSLYGSDDITSPVVVTRHTIGKMLSDGNDINAFMLEGAGHYDVPIVGLPLILARLSRLFGLPPAAR